MFRHWSRYIELLPPSFIYERDPDCYNISTSILGFKYDFKLSNVISTLIQSKCPN